MTTRPIIPGAAAPFLCWDSDFHLPYLRLLFFVGLHRPSSPALRGAPSGRPDYGFHCPPPYRGGRAPLSPTRLQGARRAEIHQSPPRGKMTPRPSPARPCSPFGPIRSVLRFPSLPPFFFFFNMCVCVYMCLKGPSPFETDFSNPRRRLAARLLWPRGRSRGGLLLLLLLSLPRLLAPSLSCSDGREKTRRAEPANEEAPYWQVERACLGGGCWVSLWWCVCVSVSEGKEAAEEGEAGAGGRSRRRRRGQE